MDKPVGYTTLSRYLKSLVICHSKGFDIGSGLHYARDRAAEVEAELAMRRQACLVDCFDIEMMDKDMAKQLLDMIARAEIKEAEHDRDRLES